MCARRVTTGFGLLLIGCQSGVSLSANHLAFWCKTKADANYSRRSCSNSWSRPSRLTLIYLKSLSVIVIELSKLLFHSATISLNWPLYITCVSVPWGTFGIDLYTRRYGIYKQGNTGNKTRWKTTCSYMDNNRGKHGMKSHCVKRIKEHPLSVGLFLLFSLISPNVCGRLALRV